MLLDYYSNITATLDFHFVVNMHLNSTQAILWCSTALVTATLYTVDACQPYTPPMLTVQKGGEFSLHCHSHISTNCRYSVVVLS